MKNTNQENWGVPYTTQSPVIIDKIKKSLQEKYNVDNVFKLQEFQELATQVMLEKYGTPRYAQAHIEHLEDVNK